MLRCDCNIPVEYKDVGSPPYEVLLPVPVVFAIRGQSKVVTCGCGSKLTRQRAPLGITALFSP